MARGYRAPTGDGLGPFRRESRESRRRLAELEIPTGTSMFGVSGAVDATVAYLQGLTTNVAVGGNVSVTSANDGVFRWYPSTAPEPKLISHPIATGRALITATAGEARVIPQGDFVQALVGYSVKDSTGAFVPGGVLATAQRYGRIYFNQRINIGIRTPEVPLTIDPVLNPGPYEIEAFFGTWVSTLNTASCLFEFRDVSLRVDVLPNGEIG
jgi:hypothetical protein